MKVNIKNSSLSFSVYNFENDLCGSGMRGYIYPVSATKSITINDTPTKTFEVLMETTEDFSGTFEYTFSKNNIFEVDSTKKIVVKVEGISSDISHSRLVIPTYNSDGGFVDQYKAISITKDGIYTYMFPSDVAKIKFNDISLGVDTNASMYPFTGAKKVSFKLYLVNNDIVIK